MLCATTSDQSLKVALLLGIGTPTFCASCGSRQSLPSGVLLGRTTQ